MHPASVFLPQKSARAHGGPSPGYLATHLLHSAGELGVREPRAGARSDDSALWRPLLAF